NECQEEEKNSTRGFRKAHDEEEDFGRPSREAISSSRFSKLVFGGAAGGGGAGGSLRWAARTGGGAGGGFGATGGAMASPPRPRDAAPRPRGISARLLFPLAARGG